MKIGDCSRKRRFGDSQNNPRKLWYRQFRQARCGGSAFGLHHEVVLNQTLARFRYQIGTPSEVKQLLQGSYRWLHEEESLRDASFHLLCNDGTILKCYSNNNTIEEHRFESVMPSGGWFIDFLPIALPTRYGINNGSAIVCSETAATGLRKLTAFLLKGIDHGA